MSNKTLERGRTAPSNLTGTSFERIETLAGFITFGSTLPLFALAYKNRENIQFPPANITNYFPNANPNRVRRAIKWINFFDADDILGYPIRPFGTELSDGGRQGDQRGRDSDLLESLLACRLLDGQ